MATGQPSTLLQYLRRFSFEPGRAQGTDGELLTNFIERRDEAAFDALMRRHGAMVLGVCHRILADEHDAEDAFQATFLVLVRKAASIVPREMVGNWLYGVAHNTALKAKAVSLKKRSRERQMTENQEIGSGRQCQNIWDDLKPLLDQELSRLPDKYRVPIVLCDLEGKAYHEAARQLGWPEGTLSGRLSRARTLLAKRLARQGLALSVALLVEALTRNAASACLPTLLASSTVRAAMLYAAGQTAISTFLPPKAAALVEGVLKTMLMRKLIISTVVLAVAVSGVGTGVLVYRTQAAQEPGSGKRQGKEQSTSNADSPPKTNVETRPPDLSKPKESKVRQLQKERLAALKEILVSKQGSYNEGRMSPTELMQAKSEVLKAELEFCESDNARILVFEKLVTNAKEVEDIAEVRFKAQRIQPWDWLMAKVNRLEAEIELERAKAKVAPKPK